MRDGPVVERFMIAVGHFSGSYVTLGFDPEFVGVGADPAFGVPTEGGLGTCDSAFELIEDDEIEDRIIVDGRGQRWSGSLREGRKRRQQETPDHDTITVRNMPAFMW